MTEKNKEVGFLVIYDDFYREQVRARKDAEYN